MLNVQSVLFRLSLPGILVFSSAAVFGQTISLAEFAIPTSGSKPGSIAISPQGDIAFTETSANKIGRISTAGVFIEVPVLTANSQPTGIALGPAGAALWFTETNANQIGRIDPGGNIVEFPIPTAGSGANQIVAGPDGALYFTESNANKIGRVVASGSNLGKITEFPIPTAASNPTGIALGPDGALWFTETAASQIGHVTTAGVFMEIPTTTAASQPSGIVAAPDNIWITELGANRIARIPIAFTSVTEFQVPTNNSQPNSITLGPDGALWFIETRTNKLARANQVGTFNEFSIPAGAGQTGSLTLGPDGALWFTDQSNNKIARADPSPTITEFSIPTPASHPVAITGGPDGFLWFVESNGSNVGRLNLAANTFKEFPTPTPNSGPAGIVYGPDGNLWVSEGAANNIAQVTPAGVITEFPVLTANSHPGPLAVGPDGAIWFSETTASKIGRISTAGVVTEFPVLTSASHPGGITAGPDGALWFVETNGNNIGRITTAGAVTEFPLPAGYTTPTGIATAPDGALWFTNSQAIGRISTAGSFTEYPLSTGINALYIVLGQDGALWFTDSNSSTLGRITTAGMIDDFPVPTTSSQPYGITSGPDGAIWFTETMVDQLARAVLPSNRKTVVPASGTTTTQTFVFRFYDPIGASNIGVADVLINNFLNGQGACYLAYSVSANTLYLVDDGGDAGGPFAGGIVLNGSGGSMQNSQCQINGSGSSAIMNGNILLLRVQITFSATFAGDKIVHLAQVNAAGFTTGWFREGVWSVPGSPATQITVTGASPARGVSTGGIYQPITLSVTDTMTTANLGVVNLLINGFINGIQACYLAYSVGANTLYLVDDNGDAGGPFAGSMVLSGPGSGSIENSQCRISGSGSSAVTSGNLLTLTLDILFKEGFTGSYVFYGAARDTLSNNNTNWQSTGTWTVQ